MLNQFGPSLYIPSDKNIFDVLQYKKITHSQALGFLRNRGIIVSNKLDKIALSKTIAKLSFDYHDYLYITKLLENNNRKEKTTRITVKVELNNDQLVEVCQKIKSAAHEDESFTITKRENSTILVANYTEIDFTKTELRQRARKKCEIELQPEDNKIALRIPATKKGKEIAEIIKSTLSNMVGEKLAEETISLESIAIPEARSLFFDEIIKSIPGYELDDVSSVDIYHKIDAFDDDQEENETEDPNNFGGYITKAALAGGGVLESEEFNQLHSRGFFISKIIWTVIDQIPGGEKVELEAEFGDPSSCTDFKYLVRGVYSYNEKNNSHNITIRPPSRPETDIFNKKLEKAAKNAYDKIIQKYIGTEDEST